MTQLRSYHFLPGVGRSVYGVRKNFWGWSKGGAKVFIGSRGQNFLLGPGAKGGTIFFPVNAYSSHVNDILLHSESDLINCDVVIQKLSQY